MRVVVFFLFGLLLLLATRGGARRKCGSRKDRATWERDQLPRVLCRVEPHRQLVNLPVPEGYDMMYPYVVSVKRCAGLMTRSWAKECVSQQSVNINFTVQVFREQERVWSCASVAVVEDRLCDSRCRITPSHCNPSQEYDDARCECKCREELMNYCTSRQLKRPGTYIWNDTTCSCLCNHQEECSDGSSWDTEHCRCLLSPTSILVSPGNH